MRGRRSVWKAKDIVDPLLKILAVSCFWVGVLLGIAATFKIIIDEAVRLW